jgi:hypothetical protein
VLLLLLTAPRIQLVLLLLLTAPRIQLVLLLLLTAPRIQLVLLLTAPRIQLLLFLSASCDAKCGGGLGRTRHAVVCVGHSAVEHDEHFAVAQPPPPTAT